MEQFPSLITNVKDLKRKKELENLISVYDEGKSTTPKIGCQQKSFRRFEPIISWPILNGFSIALLHSKFFIVHIQTDLFSEIQFLEQNYDIVKCNIWMRHITKIQNKVKKKKLVGYCFVSLIVFIRFF